MPVGLQTINDSGVVQIDQDTRSYQLKQSGSFTAATPIPLWEEPGVYTTLTFTNCTAPLLAVDIGHQIKKVEVSGSTWTYYITTNGAAGNYWLFDLAPSLIETFGLAVYDGAGDLAFQSGGKPLRIVGGAAGAYPSGPTYACVVLGWATGWDEEPWVDEETEEEGFERTYWAIGPAVSGNVVSFEDIHQLHAFDTGTIPIPDWLDSNPPILVVDVTNF